MQINYRDKKEPMMELKGEYLDYDWLIVRQPMGHLCGYVKLWKKHPLEVYEYDDDEMDIECHGGLTFKRTITKKDKEKLKIGFTPGCWIGWDYAHAGDYMSYSDDLGYPGDKRWSVEEVMKECYEVIDQLENKYPKLKEAK